MITCIVMSDGLLKDNDEFSDEDDEIQFEELHQLYTTNHIVIKEFAQYLNETLLFPDFDDSEEQLLSSKRSRRSSKESLRTAKKRMMTLKEFQILMQKDKLDYTLVRANEIRQRFTEFVLRNQGRALMDSSLIQSDGMFLNDSQFKHNSNRLKDKGKKKK